jgi:hypothetical protein
MQYRSIFEAMCPVPDWPKCEPIVRLTEIVRQITKDENTIKAEDEADVEKS